MHVIRKFCACAIATLIAAGGTGTAWAGSGGSQGGSVSSGACNFPDVNIPISKNNQAETVSSEVACKLIQNSTVAGTPSRGDSNWTPPKCWWEPIAESQFISEYQSFIALIHHTGEEASDWAQQFRQYYTDNHSTDSSGYWYKIYCTPDATDADWAASGWDQIPGDWQWIKNGNPPQKGTAPAVTTRVLAEIAAGQLTIPPTHLSMSPDSDPVGGAAPAGQIVNLPTWLWLDPKDFGTETVTAQLNNFPQINVTVTAVPKELDVTVDGGAVFSTSASGGQPASSLICKIGADGKIGSPYTPGATGSSSCSISFMNRPPQGSSFTIHARVVWEINWSAAPPGSGWPRQTALTQNIPVTVGEVQSIN